MLDALQHEKRVKLELKSDIVQYLAAPGITDGSLEGCALLYVSRQQSQSFSDIQSFLGPKKCHIQIHRWRIVKGRG